MLPRLKKNEMLPFIKNAHSTAIIFYSNGTYRLVKKFEDDPLDSCNSASIHNGKPTSEHTHNWLEWQDDGSE